MPGCDAGGISSVVLNYYRHINKDEFHFDCAVTSDIIGQNGRQLQELGANIFHLPLKSEDGKGYKKAIEKILKEGNYTAIHVHENHTSFVALRIAKKIGVPVRIAHAHTAGALNKNLKSIVRRWLSILLNPIYATNLISCGTYAARYIFGQSKKAAKKLLILPNAIDLESYSFCEETRREERIELQLGRSFTIGMVGRLQPEKNHVFALELLKSLQDKSVKMLIVGNGEKESDIRQKIQELDLEEQVCLLGRRNDVPAIMNACDMLLLPSLFEGFPVVGVEAAATGLPIILSDSITPELSVFSNVKYLSLNSEKKDWQQAILSLKEQSIDRSIGNQVVSKNGFNIQNTVFALEQLYIKGGV